MNDLVDHRNLIADYDLGHIEPHSPGLIHWHPAGMRVLGKLESWLLQIHQSCGYEQVRSPILLSRELWERSGHWDKYQDLMFVSQQAESAYAVKPMSCPGHIAIYKHRRRSYRELPLSLFEYGHVHRNEPSGALAGWMRLRGFVQDDSHVFCAPSQIGQVIGQFIALVSRVYAAFGFQKWSWNLSLRPEKRAGGDALWDQAENALRQACHEFGIHARECPGDGAFYGPKLEASLEDSRGRQWQCGVAQLDFVLPQRFELGFQNAQGQHEAPVMVHHAVLGSLERWLSIVMESQGKLPAWLSPHQVALLPISQDQQSYCEELYRHIKKDGIMAELIEDGPLGGRVREAVERHFAHIVVVGAKEAKQGNVSVRQPDGSSQCISKEEWFQRCEGDFKAP